MQQKQASAETPTLVRTAFWINMALLLVALIGPRLSEGGLDAAAEAALLFVVPMVLILVIGAAVAIYAYAQARKQSRSMSWSAFLPLAVFLAGFLVTLALVYGEYV